MQKGRQPYIRQFENYVALLLGYEPESCEQRGRCSLQYVVEADGSVYPCDFYVLDRYRMGNFLENTVEELEQRGRESGFVQASWSRTRRAGPALTFVSAGAAAAGTGKSGRTGRWGRTISARLTSDFLTPRCQG